MPSTSNGVRLVLLITENETLFPASDLPALVDAAVIAEAAGFDAVMASEHIVLGPGSDAAGVPDNPRDYALPGNQPPTTPWPSPLVLLAAIASATTNLRLIAGAIIAPLHHPLHLAQELATVDLLSRGRLVVQPTVSWHPPEYDALGVPFEERGARLDEHLEIWRLVWGTTPASFHGRYYRFDDVYLQPKPFRPQGPPMWFGGQQMHAALVRRLVRYGGGFNPLGAPSPEDWARLEAAMTAAGRSLAELEIMGGTRGQFPDASSVAPLAPALATIPAQVARGARTICIKPAQFIDDPRELPAFCAEVVDRIESLVLHPRAT